MSWPYHLPALVRISSVDGVDIGWRIQHSLAFAIELEKIGIDRID
jgi:hypothetical protein